MLHQYSFSVEQCCASQASQRVYRQGKKEQVVLFKKKKRSASVEIVETQLCAG